MSYKHIQSSNTITVQFNSLQQLIYVKCNSMCISTKNTQIVKHLHVSILGSLNKQYCALQWFKVITK